MPIENKRMSQLVGKYENLDKTKLVKGEIAIPDDHNPLVKLGNGKFREFLTKESAEYFESLIAEQRAYLDELDEMIKGRLGINDDVTSTTSTYSSSKIEDKFNEFNSNLDWKESVETYADIFTTYPNPQDGWTVNVKDTDYTYRYDDAKEEWVVVSANAIPLASETVDGKMSATQVQLLNKLSRQGAISFPTSDTSADVSAKILIINDDKWELQANKSIIYYKANAINTAENPTFNVNNTGNIPIAYNGQSLTTEDLDMAGSDDLYIVYVYDGEYWNVVGGVGGKLPENMVLYNDEEPTGIQLEEPIYKSDVINNLVSTDNESPLSANMGRELKGEINSVNSNLTNKIHIVNGTWSFSKGVATVTHNLNLSNYTVIGVPYGSLVPISFTNVTANNFTVKVAWFKSNEVDDTQVSTNYSGNFGMTFILVKN